MNSCSNIDFHDSINIKNGFVSTGLKEAQSTQEELSSLQGSWCCLQKITSKNFLNLDRTLSCHLYRSCLAMVTRLLATKLSVWSASIIIGFYWIHHPLSESRNQKRLRIPIVSFQLRARTVKKNTFILKNASYQNIFKLNFQKTFPLTNSFERTMSCRCWDAQVKAWTSNFIKVEWTNS